jgi:hypothetical protein
MTVLIQVLGSICVNFSSFYNHHTYWPDGVVVCHIIWGGGTVQTLWNLPIIRLNCIPTKAVKDIIKLFEKHCYIPASVFSLIWKECYKNIKLLFWLSYKMKVTVTAEICNIIVGKAYVEDRNHHHLDDWLPDCILRTYGFQRIILPVVDHNMNTWIKVKFVLK